MLTSSDLLLLYYPTQPPLQSEKETQKWTPEQNNSFSSASLFDGVWTLQMIEVVLNDRLGEFSPLTVNIHLTACRKE